MEKSQIRNTKVEINPHVSSVQRLSEHNEILGMPGISLTFLAGRQLVFTGRQKCTCHTFEAKYYFKSCFREKCFPSKANVNSVCTKATHFAVCICLF